MYYTEAVFIQSIILPTKSCACTLALQRSKRKFHSKKTKHNSLLFRHIDILLGISEQEVRTYTQLEHRIRTNPREN